MTDNVPLQTKDERKEIFRIIGEIKSTAEALAKLSRPMFNGLRFLSDSELSRRLSVSKSTLANYRLKGLFGFYSLEGKILYAEHEIEAYLYRNYHPPFKQSSTSIAPADFPWSVGAISSLEDETGRSQIKYWLMMENPRAIDPLRQERLIPEDKIELTPCV